MTPLPSFSIRERSGPSSVSRSPPVMPSLPLEHIRKDPRLATTYEREVAPVWTQPFGRLLLSQLAAPNLGKATVLDVMCHAGYPGLEILRRCPETRLVAIDSSPTFIDLARRKAGALIGRRAFFRTEQAEPTLPFDQSVYDLVISNLGLHDATQARVLLRELARVAKPGATVLATLPLRGSFWEFYELVFALVQNQPIESARLQTHLATWPDAAMVYGWASEAGLENISIVTEPFTILVAGGPDLFFAPVIEYGPLSAWKAILGGHGPQMQAAFTELRSTIDSLGRNSPPFELSVRAACLCARKPAPNALPTFEEDPQNSPTNPGSGA